MIADHKKPSAKAIKEAEKIAQIGAAICKFANGGCLCSEKMKPLCANVIGLATRVSEIAQR